MSTQPTSIQLETARLPITGEAKRCVVCGFRLPIGIFGVNNHNRDGRQTSCKFCCRDKTNALRVAKRERVRLREEQIEAERQAAEAEGVETVGYPTDPEGRIKRAMSEGCQTITTIKRKVKMQEEEVDDILTWMILDTSEVKITGTTFELNCNGEFEEVRTYKLAGIYGM